MHWTLERVDIAIYSGCNLRCKHCYQADIKDNEILISYDRIKKILLSSKNLGAYELSITGGEPLLHPDFLKILCFADELGYKKGILTNGTLINEDIVDNFKKYHVEDVQISLDGPRNIHDKTRGKGTFDKTIKGISLLVENNFNVSINTQITADLLESLDDWIEFLESIGVPEVMFSITAMLGDAEKNQISTPTNCLEQLRYLLHIDLEQEKIYIEQGKTRTKVHGCGALIHCLHINYDGNVYPCDFFKSIGHHSLGNIYQESIESIYKSWIQSNCGLIRYFIDGVEECNNCDFKSICSPCPARVYSLYKDFKHPDALYCMLLGKKEFTSVELSKLMYGRI